jgi:hypothetical protein
MTAAQLVDELGGFTVPHGLATQAVKLVPNASVELAVVPREKEPFECI